MNSTLSPLLFAQMHGIASYWTNFLEYWRRTLITENGIVSCALLLGALGIFIITRGKWNK